MSSINDTLDKYSFKPDFTVLVSPVIDMSTSYAHKGSVRNLLGTNPPDSLQKAFSVQLHVKRTTPPCFIVDAVNDKTVSPMNSLLYYQALLQKQVPVSFHAFPQGGHSIALKNNPGSTNCWTGLLEAWLKETGIVRPLTK